MLMCPSHEKRTQSILLQLVTHVAMSPLYLHQGFPYKDNVMLDIIPACVAHLNISGAGKRLRSSTYGKPG